MTENMFGDFALDTTRMKLRRRGQLVAIQPKVLRLLIHLVEQRERVVSNAELLVDRLHGARSHKNGLARVVAPTLW